MQSVRAASLTRQSGWSTAGATGVIPGRLHADRVDGEIGHSPIREASARGPICRISYNGEGGIRTRDGV